MANFSILVPVFAFLAAVLLVEALYLFWRGRWGPEARRLEERLRTLAGERARPNARIRKERPEPQDSLLEKLALALPQARSLQLLLHQAGLRWSPGRLLLLALCAGTLVASLGVILLHPPLVLVLGLAAGGAVLPGLYVARRRRQRMRTMERQMPEALDLMTRALRAGHAFSSALQMAGEELQEPIAGELRLAHDEVTYGVSMQQALSSLAERVPSMDVRYFVVAVLVQRESGGNLAEIMGNLSRLIRERLKLMARVRVLSSEGRLSAWILVVLPFLLGTVIALVNPDFMRPLWTDPMGIAMLKVLGLMMAAGVLILQRVIRIRV